MPAQIPYTTTLPAPLMEWLDEVARKEQTSKKAIILHALAKLRTSWKKREMVEGFKRAAKDKEVVAMAEDGLDDMLDQLAQFSS